MVCEHLFVDITVLILFLFLSSTEFSLLVHHYRFHIHQKLQLKSLSARRKQILCSLDKQVSSHANQLGLDLTRKKPQGRRPVTACLHTVGICVPVDKILDVGYRPLPMSNSKFILLPLMGGVWPAHFVYSFP